MVEKAVENMNKLEYFYMTYDNFDTGAVNLRKVLAKLGLKPKYEWSNCTEYEK